jgi:paraquat-inducible protein A
MSNVKTKTELTLSKSSGKNGQYINIFLFISFTFNVLALTTPFTQVGHFLGRPANCTLPHSVYLMWDEGLYGIAVLIVGFSIIFPFAKLFALTYTWQFEKNPQRRQKLLSIIEPLGKWSMLDVFATCIILILCNKQIFIYGTPMIGVNFFLLAIFISMITSIIIAYIHDKNENTTFNPDNVKFINTLSKRSKGFIFLIVLLSLITLILAICAPYIQISSFFLIDYSYSIFGSVSSLFSQTIVLSIFMLTTLVFFPILHITSMLIYLILKFNNNKNFPKFAYWIKIFSRFNMLDVFLLAFIIFISEGKALISTNEKAGLYLISAYIFISSIMPYIITLIRRHIENNKIHQP